jgi:hypothetical protein
MDTQMASGAGGAESWRTHCRTHRDRIRQLSEVARLPQSAEAFEDELVRRLGQAELPLEQRAVAMRVLIELRHCTARELGDFFRVPAPVTIRALALIAPPLDFAALAAEFVPGPKPKKRRTKAA